MPTKYDPAQIDAIGEMYDAGLIDSEVADKISVNVATLRRWKDRHPALAEVMSDGKANADDRVEASLYGRAIAGDVTACIFWLKNRRRKEWKDRWPEENERDTTLTIAWEGQ